VIIRRGDVFLARLGNENAEVPVVIVSRDSLNQNSPVVVIVPVVDRASRKRTYPSHAHIRAGEGGFKVDSIALGEHVRAIDTARLVKQQGHLTVHTIAEIASVLRIVLDI